MAPELRPGISDLATDGIGIELFELADLDRRLGELDPVTYEVLRNRVSQINEEQGATMMRVSGSPIAAFSGDFNMIIADEVGNVVTVGPYVQWHGVIIDSMIKGVIETRGERPGISPGDMYICNDPYLGAGHMNDVAVMAPLFYEGRLIAWTASMLHHADVGGINAGSFCIDAREPAHEPTPFPLVRMVENGELRPDLEDLWKRHSRVPDIAALDLRAQIAGNNVAHARLRELIDRYGPSTLHCVLKRTMRDAEQLFRQRLEEFPDGTWRSIQIIDKNRRGDTKLYKAQLNMRKEDDELVFNTEGTDPQTGVLSCTFGGFRAAIVTPLLPYLCHDIPWATGGIMRAVRFETEPGSLVDAQYPALTSTSSSTGIYFSMDLAQQCVNKMLLTHPVHRDEVVADHFSNWAFTMLSGDDQRGDPMVALLMDPMANGLGARSHKDGVDSGGSVCCPRAKTPMVEVNESLYPILYLYRREARDGGGAGKYRGGTGIEYAFALHDAKSSMNHLMHTWGVTLPVTGGVGGGLPGAPIEYVINRSADHAELFEAGVMPDEIREVAGEVEYPDFKGSTVQDPGDLYYTVVTGGGGFGDPLERSPEQVTLDVQDGYVSTGVAAAQYGVVVAEDGSCDEAATESQRQGMRRGRLCWPIGPAGSESGLEAADGERWPLSEAMVLGRAVRGGEGAAPQRLVAIFCARCDHLICDAAESYKDGCRQSHTSVVDLPRGADPERYGMTMVAELRQYCCPACGVLVESEVAIEGAPQLRDIEISPAAIAAWSGA